MKKLLWIVVTAVVLLGTTPLRLQADGNPPPVCPTGKVCKP